MGRQQENTGSVSQTRYVQPESRPKRLVAAFLLVIAIFWLSHLKTEDLFDATSPQDPVLQQPTLFDWDTVETKTHLHYTPCYEYLQCARLELPMDWFNQTTNATISLAVIRQPAVVPVTHPQYGGAILLNPGGPGGSGVGLLLRAGQHARVIVDTNTTDGKYFDIMSFDPRGVGLSKPRVDCLHDPDFSASWQQRVQEEGWFESSDAALGRLWSMSTAKGHICSNANSAFDGDDIKKYVSTASAARDMLELVEKHGEWREREARSLQHASNSLFTRSISKCMKQPGLPASLRYTPGTEMIQYYGFSYGSYLGGTFAAMFPDRVGRLVVDGVVEYNNYMSGNWSSNLVDTEKTMDSFYFHCARVGYPDCALANETGKSTPSEIKKRTNDIIQSLYHNPLPVYTPGADVLSYSEMKSLIFGSLYTPSLVFPLMAGTLLAIEQKDSELLAPLVRALHPTGCTTRWLPHYDPVAADAQIAIACSDGDDQSYLSRDAFQEFAKELADISPTSGSLWSTIRMNCIHHKLSAVHRFKGPWKANTSHPLLFIGNTADPVTPGQYARKMAEGFEGAVALMQDSGGHCSIATFSWCTTGYIRQYFQTGELPPANTTCAADVVPFGPLHEDLSVETAEMRATKESWERMVESSLVASPGIPGGNAWHELKQALSHS
jgi:pimeloyl-ACP methyl ester carboxylesterase